MVLVDTSPAAEFLIEVNWPGYDESIGKERYASIKLKCAMSAARGALDPSSPEPKYCLLPLPGDTPAALRKIWPSFFTADHALAQVS